MSIREKHEQRQPQKNFFEHFFASDEKGPVGAQGTHRQTAIKKSEIARVGGLVFDVDVEHLEPKFVGQLHPYLKVVLPELELRETSAAGNLHAIVHFKNAVKLGLAEKLWQPLRRLLLADPNASITMKARVVGSLKDKDDGNPHTVIQVKKGQPIAAKRLLDELSDVPVNANGELSGEEGWRRRQFRALMMLLTAPNGSPLWDGHSSHGVCPIHGSGTNPKQCEIKLDDANCRCFGDCASEGKPRHISLLDILQNRAICVASWDQVRPLYDDKPDSAGGRPVVTHNPYAPVYKFYSSVLAELAKTQRFFHFGSQIAEIDGDRVKPVTTPAALIGEIVTVMEIAVQKGGKRLYKPLSRNDAATLLSTNALLAALPPLDFFTEIPVLDGEYRLVGHGYDPSACIYCASASITPVTTVRYLKQFLDVVSFRDDGSRDNYVGLLLTNFFLRHFCGETPLPIFDANRPQVGKTMLAKCVAAVGTNHPVGTLSYTPNDEEFEKKLASHVLKSNFIIIDNAKTKRSVEVSSATLERSLTDAWLSYRQLGFNKLIERQNNIIWMLTANNARLSPDLTDRGLPIRLWFDGDPKRRKSSIGDPREFFLAHLDEIRAELLGMVEVWLDAGRPECIREFRFRKWARIIGGILIVNGYDRFLLNLEDSRIEFDPILTDLKCIAEQWPDEFKKAQQWVETITPDGLLAQIWTRGATQRAQASELGKLFGAYRGQSFDVILEDGRRVTRKLDSRSGHGGKSWAFVTCDDDGEGGEGENRRPPSRSPSQTTAPQGVATDGEGGERNSNPMSIDGGTPPANHESGEANAFCNDPESRSPRSPLNSDIAVTSNNCRSLDRVNAEVNANDRPKDVHHDSPDSSNSSDTNATRQAHLERLRESHPLPQPKLGGSPSQPIATANGKTTLDGQPIEFAIGWDGGSFQSGILAFDTETTVVENEDEIPGLVLATASDGDRHITMPADAVADFLIAHQGHTLVFHNVAFDFAVLERHLAAIGRNDARDVLWTMAQSNLLRDTMLLDQLFRLARDGTRPRPRNLGEVAREYAGLAIDKEDPFRKRYAEIQGRNLETVDRGFLDYAVKDAVATIHAYAGLAEAADCLTKRHVEVSDLDIAARYGLLTESIQVQASIALAATSRNGMHVDTDRLKATRKHLEDRRDQLAAAVEQAIPCGALGVGEHIYRRDKSDRLLIADAGTPRVNNKNLEATLRSVLQRVQAINRNAVAVPRTEKSGALSQKAEYWAPLRQYHPFIDNWLSLNEQAKLIQFTAKLIQFTANTATNHVHPKYTVMVRSGRACCSKPNIQQLPRNGGIRECFVPSSRHLLLAVDYSYIELVTLAAVCESRFGQSKLAEAIRAGVDPHVNTAAMIKGISVEAFAAQKDTDRATYDADRQRAKAINFGVPGGLGAESLASYAQSTFGVNLTIDEAKELRHELITQVYPELERYLADDLMGNLARNLGVTVAACWNALDQSGDRPEWLPQYVKNIVSGQTHRKDGQPYDPDFLDETWQHLQALNTRSELAGELVARKGSPPLAERLFGGNAAVTLTGRIRAKVG